MGTIPSPKPYKARFSIEKVMEILNDEVKRNKIDGKIVSVIDELVKSGEIEKIYEY